MKIIPIKNCDECPYSEFNDDRGHCDSQFVKCKKWNFMLYDWDGDEDFDIYNGVHPDCKFPNLFNIKEEKWLKKVE